MAMGSRHRGGERDSKGSNGQSKGERESNIVLF